MAMLGSPTADIYYGSDALIWVDEFKYLGL